MAIVFNKPAFLGTELSAIAEALQVNFHAAGGGPFTRRCEELLQQMLGLRSLLVTSATHALEMTAHLLNVKPGDEIILPSFTFVSTANAFVLRGAKPVFADVDAGGNLDLNEVARLITPKTRAIVPVHYAGNSCDMHALHQVAGGIPLVEDAAQAIGAAFAGQPLGTFGALAAFSFHETKNVGCGEGGALIIRDPALVERAEYYRDKGTNRSRFLEGLVDKYTWVDVGSSPVLSEVSAAYLSTQLEQVPRILARRREIWDRYDAKLGPAMEKVGGYVIRPHSRNQPNGHLFALVFSAPVHRAGFIAHMKRAGIVTPFHYVALHLSPMGRGFHDGRSLPRTEQLSSCLVRLPIFFNMLDSEVDTVIGRALEFLSSL